jgi:hypothetical protein
VAEQQTTTAEAAAGGDDLVVLRREMLQLPKAVAVGILLVVLLVAFADVIGVDWLQVLVACSF